MFSPERPQVQPSPLGQSPWGRSSPAKSRRCANRRGRGRGRGRGRDGLSRGRHYTRLSLPAVLTQRSGWALKPGDVERERESTTGGAAPFFHFWRNKPRELKREVHFREGQCRSQFPSPGERKRQGRERKVWMPDRGEGTIKAQAEGPPGSPPSTGGTQVAKARSSKDCQFCGVAGSGTSKQPHTARDPSVAE